MDAYSPTLSPPPCVTTNPRTSSFLPHPPAPLPKVENLTISNITPYGFRVSWKVKQQQQRSQRQELAPSSGSFSHFHVVVTDSGWLLEPQEFTVPGNQSHLDVSGLITGIGYEVRVTGVSDSGLLSRPLTTVAVTGTTLREASGNSVRSVGNSANTLRTFHHRNLAGLPVTNIHPVLACGRCHVLMVSSDS